MNQRPTESPTVAVVGGGLAGLAAGCALSDAGFRVTLFERRPFLGGRASSYQHPGTGEIVDNCQHVLLGCCTNLIEFYERTGVAEKIRWYDRLTFLEPGGSASVIGASFLPAPFHTAPSFLAAHCLSLADKVAIARAMLALMPLPAADAGESFLEWLKRHHQTQRAIERFWKTVLVSALNEDLDRVSVTYAAQVFRESFLKSAQAGRMGVPSVPLTELYNSAGEFIRAHGGEVELRGSVDSFRPQASQVTLGINAQERTFDFVVLAVPFDVLARILPHVPESQLLRESLQHFETSPITGIHLWFDRQVSNLDHAVLLDRTIQWMFHKSRLLGQEGHDLSRAEAAPSTVGASAQEGRGSYVELVVSSSKSLVEESRTAIIDLALKEMPEFFPQVAAARLVKATVIKEIYATYSPRPGIDRFRPSNATVWPRVFLAGDWTATGWPATMEGAVRSGYLAAQTLARSAGQPDATYLVPDLPPSGLMRFFR
ncbi:MAG TPA: hydroxysqualene dehydroxylase HpnE [Terriglobales bacterium]|nr:hydroxysqualene dehydroxylase HpnE [Terriglobales bacterium]